MSEQILSEITEAMAEPIAEITLLGDILKAQRSYNTIMPPVGNRHGVAADSVSRLISVYLPVTYLVGLSPANIAGLLEHRFKEEIDEWLYLIGSR